MLRTLNHLSYFVKTYFADLTYDYIDFIILSHSVVKKSKNIFLKIYIHSLNHTSHGFFNTTFYSLAWPQNLNDFFICAWVYNVVKLEI